MEIVVPKNTNFERLEPFADEVTGISLEGHGSYFDNEKKFEKVCNEKLDQFYQLDSISHTSP